MFSPFFFYFFLFPLFPPLIFLFLSFRSSNPPLYSIFMFFLCCACLFVLAFPLFSFYCLHFTKRDIPMRRTNITTNSSVFCCVFSRGFFVSYLFNPPNAHLNLCAVYAIICLSRRSSLFIFYFHVPVLQRMGFGRRERSTLRYG